MPYEPLTQDPISVGLKDAAPEAVRILKLFVAGLNRHMLKVGRENIWYQPDNSKWPQRYFWMFLCKSEKRDFITRIEFAGKYAVQVDFSHFGAKKPKPVEFMSPQLFESLQYKGFPPHVRMKTAEDLERFLPLIANHYDRILMHLKSGGILPPRGWSHIEVALKAYLRVHDRGNWTSWDKLDFLGRREVDMIPSAVTATVAHSLR